MQIDIKITERKLKMTTQREYILQFKILIHNIIIEIHSNPFSLL